MTHAMRVSALLPVLVLAAGALPAAAAETTLQVDSTLFTVRTGTDSGSCYAEVQPGGGGVTVSCTDAYGNGAAVNSVTGCLWTRGRGLCAPDAEPGAIAAAVLTCENGTRYNVSAGTTSQSCDEGHDSLTCHDDHGNSASADCAEGCGNTSGKGCCCRLGSEGCKADIRCGRN
ncbi:MAG: hypothetical protein Kow0062_21550 [Acidobacteriota bacterium]